MTLTLIKLQLDNDKEMKKTDHFETVMRNIIDECMSRGGHGLLKVLLGPAMLYHSMCCGRSLLKSRFRCSCSQGGQPAAVVYPLGHLTPMILIMM
jgi:hypothetical protein